LPTGEVEKAPESRLDYWPPIIRPLVEKYGHKRVAAVWLEWAGSPAWMIRMYGEMCKLRELLSET
jgi:hypothetical protein